ncbi:uncharacterized protein LOC143677897 [Tamandua tetradactyla]|uniref:uncharacterized protein LOC143677897 n=1 Tax=Tamandua tetradactyla TaxID=48850 RepID=UPI0040544F63
MKWSFFSSYHKLLEIGKRQENLILKHTSLYSGVLIQMVSLKLHPNYSLKNQDQVSGGCRNTDDSSRGCQSRTVTGLDEPLGPLQLCCHQFEDKTNHRGWQSWENHQEYNRRPAVLCLDSVLR